MARVKTTYDPKKKQDTRYRLTYKVKGLDNIKGEGTFSIELSAGQLWLTKQHDEDNFPEDASSEEMAKYLASVLANSYIDLTSLVWEELEAFAFEITDLDVERID